mmetsp:Transcript_9998/g.32411  ORF Transcript_9998/g.32411 Transcript_9998/m.32411 type:complete len:220 (+) Transcript_9998:166-825(+)
MAAPWQPPPGLRAPPSRAPGGTAAPPPPAPPCAESCSSSRSGREKAHFIGGNRRNPSEIAASRASLPNLEAGRQQARQQEVPIPQRCPRLPPQVTLPLEVPGRERGELVHYRWVLPPRQDVPVRAEEHEVPHQHHHLAQQIPQRVPPGGDGLRGRGARPLGGAEGEQEGDQVEELHPHVTRAHGLLRAGQVQPCEVVERPHDAQRHSGEVGRKPLGSRP